jgi:hypothetical protein
MEILLGCILKFEPTFRALLEKVDEDCGLRVSQFGTCAPQHQISKGEKEIIPEDPPSTTLVIKQF